MSISLDSLQKVELSGAASRSIKKGDQLTGILKVRMANYVPDGFVTRSRISPKMYTGSFKGEDLERIQADDNVESLSLSKRLDVIE